MPSGLIRIARNCLLYRNLEMTTDNFEMNEKANDPSIVCRSITAAGAHEPLQKIARDAEVEGLGIEFVDAPDDTIYASIELIGFTAVCLFILKPVYDDLYRWLKERVPLLWRDFFDTNNSERIHVTVLTARGPKSTMYSAALSIFTSFQYGQVKLMFPEDCSESVMQQSCVEFANLMHAYSQGEAYNDIDLDSEIDCYSGVIVVAFAESENRLVVVNPFAHRSEQAIARLRYLENLRRRQIERRSQKIEPYLDPNESK